MSSSKFQVVSHVIDGQHIREYPRATRQQDDVRLKVCIKQYIPLNNLPAAANSITIIGLHGNGFPKETYEPLWDELLDKANTTGLPIRSIWIADSSHQGASGVANEHVQGDDPSYLDLSRDLLHMINVFRDDFVAPIFGIGHSMGACQLVHLSYLHPRLLHSIALVEPIIQNSPPAGPNPSMYASFRPDLFRSRDIAESTLRMHPMFKSIDSRALKRYADSAFRELPTRLYPDQAQAQALLDKAAAKAPKNGPDLAKADKTGPPVTLTTTKHQEAWSYARAVLDPLLSDPSDSTNRLLSPDLDPKNEGQLMFVRPEILSAFLRLPELRPTTLYLYGENSFLNTEDVRAKKSHTGTGCGGSGGLASGRVKEIIVSGAGHMLPLEKLNETADILIQWFIQQWKEWQAEKAFYKSHDSKVSTDEGLRMSKVYRELVMEPSDSKRPTKEKL